MRVARVVVAIGLVLALVVGVLDVALQPNETPEEGAADPVLWARRPVINALRAAGVLDSAMPYVPSVADGMVTEGLPTGEELPVCRQEFQREPVYRGLFRLVGRRLTYRLTYFREHDESWRAVRLCYAVRGERFVAAEDPAPKPDVAEVSGFVPTSARGGWVEYTDDKGEIHGLDGWGDIDPFWRD